MPDLWPFEPEAGITEHLQWMTDVRQAASGEMRESLDEARQTLSYSFVWDAEELAIAQGLIESGPTADWYVPLWTDATPGVAVSSVDTSLAVDTDGDYVDGGQAVIWVDRSEYQVVTITTVGAGMINLDAAVGADFADAVVAPVRTASAPNGFEFVKEFASLINASIRFRVKDTSETATSPFSQYLGADVISDLSYARSSLGGAIRQQVSVVDIGYGGFEVVDMRDDLDHSFSLNWRDETLATKKRRREWLKAVRGRDAVFWLPSRSRDIRLAAPALATDTEISVYPIYADTAQYVGKHIAIDGAIFREITGAAPNGGVHDLTIAAPGVALTDPEISVMRLYRLGSDTVEINHESNMRALGQVTINEVNL